MIQSGFLRLMKIFCRALRNFSVEGAKIVDHLRGLDLFMSARKHSSVVGAPTPSLEQFLVIFPYALAIQSHEHWIKNSKMNFLFGKVQVKTDSLVKMMKVKHCRYQLLSIMQILKNNFLMHLILGYRQSTKVVHDTVRMFDI